ncbi:hypothetical protein TELCIR_19070 [Teladorsagia circumcincta]|uniref:Uncharacterized protein n=1 Tax=Teladorsagia circumcincta TaxID=45464 RepID=A0A2G9TNG1_TELCI|nr:hypothetical protein TELCIR_19070 [Teladorsagia circumcincta]
MCDNSSYRTIPLEPVPPGAYNATTSTPVNDRHDDPSKPYAAQDYGYQAYISPTSEQPTTSDATVPNQESHGDIDMRDGSTVLAASKSDSISSQLLRQEAKKIAKTATDDALPEEELLDESTSLLDVTEHSASSSKATRKLSSSREKHAVAEYIPTPLAELERMKQEEKKRKKKKDKEYEPSFEEVKEKVKAGSSKRRLLSEDEISTLFEKERSHSKRASASPSKSPELTSEPTPVSKSSKKEVECKSVTVPKDVETSSSATSNSAEDVREASPEQLVATKKRIAREGSSRFRQLQRINFLFVSR